MTRRFRKSDPVDFVVVGSGAAGGVMARELAQAGFGVVVMEQGPRLEAQDFEHDELKYWFNYGITNDPARSPQTFRKTPLDEARPPQAGALLPLTYARTVGGSSVHYAANYWRHHEVDFRERSLHGAIPGSKTGRSPTRSSSRTTRRSIGRSACLDSPGRTRTSRPDRGPTRCRRCRSSPPESSSSAARAGWAYTRFRPRWPLPPGNTAAARPAFTAGSALASAARCEPRGRPYTR